jgi:hypothetical protein
VEAAVNTVANVVHLKAIPVNAKADRAVKVAKAKTNNAKNLALPAIAGVREGARTSVRFIIHCLSHHLIKYQKPLMKR